MTEQTMEQVSKADFYRYADSIETRVELIEGEVVPMSSPLLRHQRIVALLTALLVNLKRGMAIPSPFDVEFDEHNVFQPDILWLAPDTRAVLTSRRLLGAPDLVVEILSKSTRDNDKRLKFRVYQRAGVREYWIIDPEARHLEQYVLTDGRLMLQDTYGATETFTSALLGIEIVLADIFEEDDTIVSSSE